MTKAWIGLVEVEAEPGHDVLDAKSNVNVVALSDDESGFRKSRPFDDEQVQPGN